MSPPASTQPKRELEIEPENILPGSRPLREFLRERYAQTRALGYGIIESGRRAGWSPDSGAASKAEASRLVQDRIAYLSDLNADKIRRQRAEMERLLAMRAAGNMDNFVRYEWSGRGKSRRLVPTIDLSKLNGLSDAERRELMAQVESIEHTKFGPKIKIFDPGDAVAQLRKMNGLDAAEKYADPDGRGVGTQAAEAAAKQIGDMNEIARARAVALLFVKAKVQKEEAGM